MEEDRGFSQPIENWTSAQAYEPYVGRWSRVAARKFLDWLAIPPGNRWLDIGCGTGALTEAILEIALPEAVKGIDTAEGYIAFVRQKITDPRAVFLLGDVQALPVETGSYDAVVSGLSLNFVSQPDQAVKEMARAAKPGGIVAAYVWDYANRMQFMRHFWNAAAALDQAAADLDQGRRFPLCNPGPLKALFRGAGLTRVEVQPVDIWTVFQNFDDFWIPFLGSQGPAPGYVMSLAEEGRIALRERIRASLPFALDGSIPLMARAWGVRGVFQGEPSEKSTPIT